MTFDENGADREPPQLGGFFVGTEPDRIGPGNRTSQEEGLAPALPLTAGASPSS